MQGFAKLSIHQIQLLAQLAETKGIRDLARKNSVDPAAISRLLKEAERIFGFALVVRSKRGLILTAEGQQFVRLANEVVASVGRIEEFRPASLAHENVRCLTLGSRGYLVTLLARYLAESPIDKFRSRFKFVDSSPADLLRACLSGFVDVAVHFEDWSWPSSWITQEVGAIRWGLVARRRHPIKAKIDLGAVRRYPFITASYLASDRIERSPDAFPLRLSQRWLGHEAQTAFTSREIVLASDHLGFLPLVTMEKEILSGEIRIIDVADMEPVSQRLRLSYHQDRTPATIEKLLRQTLSRLNDMDRRLAEQCGL